MSTEAITFRWMTNNGSYEREIRAAFPLPRVGERVHFVRKSDGSTISGTVWQVTYKEPGAKEPFNMPDGITVDLSWDGFR